MEATGCSSTETEQFVQVITTGLPASADRLEAFSKAQANDSICSKLIEFCTFGWPPRNQLSRDLKQCWRFRGNLTLSSALLLYQSCIVIPLNMRRETLAKIQHGHQGIQRCRLHVASSVWWPGVTSTIEQFVQACPTCQKLTNLHREPLLSTPLPRYPWEWIAADLFELKSFAYLLVADYYFRSVEVQKLTTTTSSSIVRHLKIIFARFGIPATKFKKSHDGSGGLKSALCSYRVGLGV